MGILDDMNEQFDEDIPDEVLNSDGWSPRLLPDLDNLNTDYGYDDMEEDFE